MSKQLISPLVVIDYFVKIKSIFCYINKNRNTYSTPCPQINESIHLMYV